VRFELTRPFGQRILNPSRTVAANCKKRKVPAQRSFRLVTNCYELHPTEPSRYAHRYAHPAGRLPLASPPRPSRAVPSVRAVKAELADPCDPRGAEMTPPLPRWDQDAPPPDAALKCPYCLGSGRRKLASRREGNQFDGHVQVQNRGSKRPNEYSSRFWARKRRARVLARTVSGVFRSRN